MILCSMLKVVLGLELGEQIENMSASPGDPPSVVRGLELGLGEQIKNMGTSPGDALSVVLGLELAWRADQKHEHIPR